MFPAQLRLLQLAVYGRQPPVQLLHLVLTHAHHTYPGSHFLSLFSLETLEQQLTMWFRRRFTRQIDPTVKNTVNLVCARLR